MSKTTKFIEECDHAIVTCPACSEESEFRVHRKMTNGVGVLWRENGFEIDRIDDDNTCLLFWYRGVCPKCNGEIAVADRVKICMHDHVGYDYGFGQHVYQQTIRFKGDE